MSKDIVAMILAGGKGTRLKSLTKKIAKPAVSFGAKYRIIDFPLSNCANSGINTVGVLTQYESVFLNTYIGNGEKWGLNGVRSLTATLAPRQTEEGLSWYRGTADAIYQNIDFLDSQDPTYVLILSGDHIYASTYKEMIKQHIDSGADCTISVIEVPMEEASRFGILVTDDNGQIIQFQEKPKNPSSNLASMGVYIFTYKSLRKELINDAKNEESSHDFGKDIIPNMLASNKKLMAYVFKGYWKDVGTISSLHEANMDILEGKQFDLNEIHHHNKIYSEDTNSLPQYVGNNGSVKNSVINQGAVILGSVDGSVISNEAVVEKGAIVSNCVIMPNAKIGINAKVYNAIVGPNTLVDDGDVINENGDEIVLVANNRR